MLINQFNIQLWLNRIGLIPRDKTVELCSCFEKALLFFPRSHKLWRLYLEYLVELATRFPLTDELNTSICAIFERSLVHMNKMPTIWLAYLEFLKNKQKNSLIRTVFDRALQSLPISQHQQIWNFYLSWSSNSRLPEALSTHFFQRYTFYARNFLSFYDLMALEETSLNPELFQCFLDSLNKEYLSDSRAIRRLCELCIDNVRNLSTSIEFERIIRRNISIFPTDIGYWMNLGGEYLTRLGLFEKARDIYALGIASVYSTRDFTILFESLIKIEESIISAKLSILQNSELAESEQLSIRDEIDLRLSRLENLMETRPLLLNAVQLRQSPNDIRLWRTRVKLLKTNNPQLVNETFKTAIRDINPSQCRGKFCRILIDWALYCEKFYDSSTARSKFDLVSSIEFKTPDELLQVWCARLEFEIRNKEFSAALDFARNVTDKACLRKDLLNTKYALKLFALHLDLEESFGSLDSCRAAYERLFDLKIISVNMALNFACYLEERKFYEQSFAVYEKCVNAFPYPQAGLVWLIYLQKFADRYGKSKFYRLEDLFERALKSCPSENRILLFIKYFEFQELFGNERKAVFVLERAFRSVSEPFRLDTCRLFIKKTQETYGPDKVRAVYENTIKSMKDEDALSLCLDFFQMEQSLGEIDRARAILKYASQFADSSQHVFWTSWKKFEDTYGSEETFKEMIRIQRSQEFATANSFVI